MPQYVLTSLWTLVMRGANWYGKTNIDKIKVKPIVIGNYKYEGDKNIEKIVLRLIEKEIEGGFLDGETCK